VGRWFSRIETVVGVVDVLIGLALALVPGTVLSAAGVDTPDSALFVRLVGTQVAALGGIGILAARGARSLMGVTALCGLGHLGAGIVLLLEATDAGGGALVRGLGVVEVAIGIGYLVVAVVWSDEWRPPAALAAWSGRERDRSSGEQ
jgi:hypothetical protein